MIATPYFPYDPHSVWNRNQLGQLDTGNLLMVVLLAVGGYLAYKYIK